MILIKNLVKTFRRVRALDGIKLSIKAGERVALTGSNGAGKTTLIRCLLGEYTCDGVVRIDGFDPR
ncbi:MAG: ATP-binding cassette domain-containing protein, partial [Azoarcus sp.]|nr:ATP-binding cassette domain-containing protein [Azoarcus sp.]